MIQAEQGEASMSIADVDQSGVGKKKATKVTADRATEGDGGTSSVKEKRRHGIIEQATYFNCIVLIIAAAFAIGTTSSAIVDVAMSLGIFNAVYVIWQRYQLSAVKLLREVINSIREEVNELIVINDNLTITTNNVNTEVQRLSSIETDVKQILAEQKEGMEEFMSILRENREIQNKMEKCLKNDLAQELIEQVVRSDQDKDFKIDPEEIDMLMMRLGTLDAVIIDEEKFRKEMELRGYGLFSVLTIIKDLVGHDVDDDGGIFKFDMKAYKNNYT